MTSDRRKLADLIVRPVLGRRFELFEEVVSQTKSPPDGYPQQDPKDDGPQGDQNRPHALVGQPGEECAIGGIAEQFTKHLVHDDGRTNLAAGFLLTVGALPVGIPLHGVRG